MPVTSEEPFGRQRAVGSADVEHTTLHLMVDNEDLAAEIRRMVAGHGYAVRSLIASNLRGAWERPGEPPQVLIVGGQRVAHSAGLTGLRRRWDEWEGPSVVLVLETPDLEAAIQAVREYAEDVVVRPLRPGRLLAALDLAVMRQREALAARQKRERTLEALRALAGQAASAVNAFNALNELEERGRPANPPNTSVRDALRPAMATTQSAEDIIRRILRLKSLRKKHFPDESLDNEMWDMLLHLADARIEGSKISVSVLGFTVGIPDTTALRKIRELEAAGLVRRVSDPHDKRRSNLELVDAAFERLKRYLADAAKPDKG
ncbi:MAG: MarR family transcriptional regulator [Alphaproteobacteria bacterium]|nr:MarR family transcriptional regulator [Alphaproteobacteria bacterium]